jgi:hypothetical protein
MISGAPSKPREEPLSEVEVESRRDAALLRALSTPHKQQKEMKLGRKKKASDDSMASKKVSR